VNIDPNSPTLTDAEKRWLIHGDEKKCERCDGKGWVEPIGPKEDGSYITSRPCPQCRGNEPLRW
jgi:DnaJ-class molecular chaperone